MRGLNETIEHLKKVVERNRWLYKNCPAELDTREHLTAGQWADEMEDIVGWLEELVKLRELKSTMGSDTYYIIPKNGTWIVNGVNILDKIKEAMDEAQGIRVMKKEKSKKVRFSHDSYAYCPHCGREIVDFLMKPGRCEKCNGEIDWD